MKIAFQMTMAKILLLTPFFLGISPVDAQVNDAIATCTSSSTDCCWVTRFWQLMGKRPLVDYTKQKACCSVLTSAYWQALPGIKGVSCNDYGNVTQIFWSGLSLKGRIPDRVGMLKNLEGL